MRKLKWISISVFIILILFLIATLIYFSALKQESKFLKQTESLQKKVITEDKGKKEILEKILTKWIYEHSNRISIESSKIIVCEVMKTNKPLLLLALIEVESNFVVSAVSNKGAVGLTQIMFEVHGKSLINCGIIKEKRDLFDIIPSIKAGNYVLDGYLVQSKGNVPKSLEFYLGGKDGVYLNKILSHLSNLYILTAHNE